MRLPDKLFHAVESKMAGHLSWHVARLPIHSIPAQDREEWRTARRQHPDAKLLTEEGSGRQFLEFHREMMRHFHWILKNTDNQDFAFRLWTGIPDWLKHGPSNPRGLTAEYIKAFHSRVETLLFTGTADQLGSFLESNKRDQTPGSNIHNLCHGEIASYEYRPGSNAAGAEMDDFKTAYLNRHFWEFHAWLDEIYAEWQRRHGEAVIQTPRDPDLDHAHNGHGKLGSASVPRSSVPAPRGSGGSSPPHQHDHNAERGAKTGPPRKSPEPASPTGKKR